MASSFLLSSPELGSRDQRNRLIWPSPNKAVLPETGSDVDQVLLKTLTGFKSVFFPPPHRELDGRRVFERPLSEPEDVSAARGSTEPGERRGRVHRDVLLIFSEQMAAL